MENKIVPVGILTIVLAVFAVSSAVALPIPDGKQAIIWFEPDPSSAALGEDITVQLKVNTSVKLSGWADWIYFDPDVVNITNADYTGSAFPKDTGFGHWGNYVKIGGRDEDYCEPNTGELLLVTLTLEGINPGTSQLYHHPDHVEIYDCDIEDVNAMWVHGNFTCTAPQETFSKELVKGWNLVSLPLNAPDMTVANIMSSVSGPYDALYRYDASTHSWVPLSSSDTMENGVGYFVHMTSAGTWTYTGSAYTDMNISLEQGLNMIGWLNCSRPIDDALSSIEGDYWYVARWNATAQRFEVYNPVAPPQFNDFTAMERGEGYFISMKGAETLTASC